MCELRLKIRETHLQPRIEQLYRELHRAGIAHRPHVWISDEWFTPDGVPGFAIPFYLAHPRLQKLERSQMFECEGASYAECMKIMRHEAGHALDNAYDLRELQEWKTHFGDFNAEYPEHYHPAPASRDFVLHLNAWYAQAHPAEDFAETFAVWLADPEKTWRDTYKGWGALAKLEAVEAMVASIRGTRAPNKKRSRVQPLATRRIKLGDHYQQKREFYEVGVPTQYDAELLRLFAAPEEKKGTAMRAAPMLSRMRRAVRNAVSETTGVHHYTVEQLLKRMIARTRQLKLVLRHDVHHAEAEFIALLTRQVMSAAEHGHGRIPL